MNAAIDAIAGSLIVILMLPGALFAREKVKPLTVCEILADTKRFGSTPVAVLGRLDCPSSMENACYLIEDRCDRPVVSADHTWPSKIWIEFIRPAAPKSKVEVDQAILSERLSVVRKSTKLGTHRIVLFKGKNGVVVPDRWSDQPDEWTLAYGRILITKALQHYSGAAAALEVNPNDMRHFKDEEYPASKDPVEK